MKRSVILLGVASTIGVGIFMTALAQQTSNPNSVRKGRQPVETIDFNSQQRQEQVKAVPAGMRFALITPPENSGLTPTEGQIWQLPKTSRRPAFCVVGTYYRDSVFPLARVLVLQWKHVPGMSALSASGISETPFNPFSWQKADWPARVLGTMKGTDVAFFSAGLPDERATHVASWVPSDTPPLAIDPHILQMRTRADTNARALATAVQGRAISANVYDGRLASYAVDLGGRIPVNPCTGTATGYFIEAHRVTATVGAKAGTKCGKWTPLIFSLTL